LPVAILIILRRNLRPRKLKIERMWFYPSLLIVTGSLTMMKQPPLAPIALSAIAAAGVIGVLIGWQRGRLTNITIDAETGD